MCWLLPRHVDKDRLSTQSVVECIGPASHFTGPVQFTKAFITILTHELERLIQMN